MRALNFDLAALFQRTKYLLQNRAAGADRILADFLFLLANHQKQAVQRLAGDVLLDVRIFFFDQPETGSLARKFVVLSSQTDFFSGLGYHGQKFHPQRGAGLINKELGYRGIAASQNIFGIVDVHGLDRADQQIPPHRHSGFGGPVDRGHQLINALTLTQSFHQFGCIFEVTWQRNANFRVTQESIRLAKQGNRRQRTFLKGRFEAGAGFSIADTAQIAQRQRMGLAVSGGNQQAQRAGTGLVKISTLHDEGLPLKKIFPQAVCRLLLAGVLALGGTAFLSGCGGAQAAPESTFVLLDGSKKTTADFKGKVTLVNFWATSCVTCVAEMPKLVATHNKYKNQGYDTLAVAMSYDPPNYVVNFFETRQLPFKVAIDNTGAAAKAWGDVQLTPTTFLVNKRGQIVKQFVGEPDFTALHQLIEKLLAET